MTKPSALLVFALSALVALLAPAAVASAANKKTKAPVITRVSPMRVGLNGKITIRGKNFSSRRTRNTVIFRGPDGRTAFIKPSRASSRKLVVKVPAAVRRLFTHQGSKLVPTRFKLRVLTRRFSKFTTQRLSPVVVPAGFSDLGPLGGGSGGSGGVAGAPCGSGSDWDGDLLSNSTEVSIGTDPCVKDTDGDSVSDGYEYQSALDLNHYPSSPPLPYPGKRPYPNALDPSDGSTDYDGDGMTLREESIMWTRFSSDGVARGGAPATLSNLLYSDGLQSSQFVAAPSDTLAAWSLDANGDGSLKDGERDADGDLLSNWDEANGQMTEAWWPAEHNGDIEPKESAYPGINFLDNADLSGHDAYADSDIDGDGVADGQDDADHDGLTNEFEVRRPDDWDTQAWTPTPPSGFVPGANSWAYVNPFNPCKPFRSDRCHEHPPFGYYTADERPPVGPDAPGGYPGSHPTTPNG
jgi:hypothetical protein